MNPEELRRLISLAGGNAKGKKNLAIKLKILTDSTLYLSRKELKRRQKMIKDLERKAQDERSFIERVKNSLSQ